MGLVSSHSSCHPAKWLGSFLVCSLLLLVLAGCNKHRETPAEIAARHKILLLGNGSEPKGIDPHVVTGVPENNIIMAVIEGLIAYHPYNDFLPDPGVAESWEHNEDCSTWVFHLRKNAMWTNGDPVIAQDFVYSYRRMLTPTLAARYADMLYIIKNAEAYHKGKITDFDQVQVKALDDHTLEIGLVGPIPYFLSMLKHYSWYPVNPRVIEAHGGIDNRDASWTQVENFVGNGPFKLKYWKTNSYIEVEKSKTYWDYENVKPNGIRFFPIERQSTEEAAFRAGQIHYCYQIPLDRIDYYRKKAPELIHFDDYLGTYFYRFNVTRPPLDNPLVRKALTLAIDQKAIVENITRGNEIPAYGYVYASMAGYKSPGNIHFDPEKARQLLAEAGYPDGKGFPKIDILINTQEGHKIIAEAVQAMWKKYLNVDIGLLNQEWKVYLDSQYNLKYDISRSGWIGDYMDPVTFLQIFASDSGNNQTGWGNERYDELNKLINLTGDQEKRLEMMQEMETILLDELPIAPIYWYTRKYLLSPVVKDWNPKLLDFHPYKYIDFKEP